MRIFIGIELPLEIKEKVSSVINEFKLCGINAKWIKKDSLHITLNFLGEVKDDKNIARIKNITKAISQSLNCFQANLQEFGFFPNGKNPRIFFLDVSGGSPLRYIHQELENSLEKMSPKKPKERRVKPHITLARIKNPENIKCLKEKLNDYKIKGSFSVEGITIFKSTLTKNGAVYEIIFKSKFNK